VTPRTLYLRLAFAEVVTWTLLILGMIGKYALGWDWATMVGGSIHGFVFLCYVAATLAVWTDKRWPTGTGIVGLASAVVPYATVPFERSVDRRGLLEGPWRLAPGGEAPRTLPERILGFALRSPIVALLVTLVLVAVVFSLLLMAGKPTEWFS
jgi:integral membrane protein